MKNKKRISWRIIPSGRLKLAPDGIIEKNKKTLINWFSVQDLCRFLTICKDGAKVQ